MGLFGAIVGSVLDGAQRAVEAEKEGMYMSADELAHKLNVTSNHEKRMGYISAAKKRGDIGRDSSGRFFAK